MNKSGFTKFINTATTAVKKHSPEILTGLGIAGMITTTVLAVKATPKALKAIEAKCEEEGVEKLPPVEVIKTTWKCYIPAAITGVTSAACIIGASSIHAGRNAALVTLYNLSQSELIDYKETVVETIGEKKEKAIKEKIAQKKIEKVEHSQAPIIITGAGDTLFLEPISMRPFKSDIETIRRIVNDLNYRMTTGMEEYISLSELYSEIGLSQTRVSDSVGWNIGRDGQIEIEFTPGIVEDGRPCLVLDYVVEPRYDFHKLS